MSAWALTYKNAVIQQNRVLTEGYEVVLPRSPSDEPEITENLGVCDDYQDLQR